MKVYQYNQRIQYWYDRQARTWFCQQNDINGNLVDRRDDSGNHIPAMDAYTKSDIIDECRILEEQL